LPDVSPEGYQNAGPSCSDRVVLVDQATEEIAPLDPGYGLDRVDVAAALRGSKLESAMRALCVVVANVGSENAVEVPWAEEQGPVEHLGAKGLHTSLSKCVGFG